MNNLFETGEFKFYVGNTDNSELKTVKSLINAWPNKINSLFSFHSGGGCMHLFCRYEMDGLNYILSFHNATGNICISNPLTDISEDYILGSFSEEETHEQICNKIIASF